MFFAALNFDPWILAFSALTVIATIWMGFWSARRSKTAHDFFVAGRSVSVGWNASAISGEYLSAASFMGVAGMVMSSGYDALWYPVCYACGYLFLLLFIAGPLRRFGAYTIPDFAEGRFDSPLFRKIAVVFVLFIGFFYTMPQMKGAGTTLAYIFPGLPYWAGVVLVGAVITLNVALGGMKGITLVQAFQYWLKMFAISVPIFVLMMFYGNYGKQVGANDPNRNPWSAFHGEHILDSSFREIENPKNDDVESFRNLLESTNAPKATGREFDLNTFLKIYKGYLSELSNRTGQVFAQMTLDSCKVLFPPPGTTVKQLQSKSGVIGAMEESLVAANVGLAEQGGRLHVYDYRHTAAVKKRLPEKAPTDETWISPFGPLTTKAAKAAGLSSEKSKPYSLLYTYSLIIALVCGTAGLPHILVRFYTNPDGTAAKRTTMWVMILIGVFYLFPPVFGVMGRNLLPELYAGTGAKGTDKVVLELPKVLDAGETGSGEKEKRGKGEISTAPPPLFSSAAPTATKPSKRFPWGSILSGIACAGAFAAFMSTFSGLLVSMTGALAHDVYGRMLRPKSTPNQRMRAFRIAAVIVGGIAILLGMQVEQFQINFMVGQAFAIAAASYFPLLFMSAWWRGMTMKGAAAGMLTGGCLALAGITLTSFSDLATAPNASAFFKLFAGLNPFWAANPLLRILCEQPAIWTVPLAIALMIIVSKLTTKEVPSDIRMKMLVLHAPEKLGLKQEYIQEHQHGH
jgi:Na+(H+)/acetate symporter ActP